jgi:hypothetical protein
MRDLLTAGTAATAHVSRSGASRLICRKLLIWSNQLVNEGKGENNREKAKRGRVEGNFGRGPPLLSPSPEVIKASSGVELGGKTIVTA